MKISFFTLLFALGLIFSPIGVALAENPPLPPPMPPAQTAPTPPEIPQASSSEVVNKLMETACKNELQGLILANQNEKMQQRIVELEAQLKAKSKQ